MVRSLLKLSAAALVCFTSTQAVAATIVYTISGTGSGNLGGNPFSDAPFNFELTGDTDTIATAGVITQLNPLATAQVTISGLGTTTFEIPTRIGFNGGNSRIFFSRASGLDLFNFSPSNPVDISSPFGPVAGTRVSALGQFVNIPTTLGLLRFDASSDVQFAGSFVSTAAVPEPTTWAMMLLGFGFVGGAMRSAKRRQKVTVSYA